MQLDARYVLFVPLVVALVEAMKEFGVVGKWAKVAALVISALLVFGSVAVDAFPGISPWLVGVLQMVLLALSAMGGYDLYKMLPNALSKKE